MTDSTRTYEIRVHWTRFGVAVAVVKTAFEGPGVDTRRSEMISREFGLPESAAEMLDSAVMQVLMMLSELPQAPMEARNEPE